jgi:hypothetical protein
MGRPDDRLRVPTLSLVFVTSFRVGTARRAPLPTLHSSRSICSDVPHPPSRCSIRLTSRTTGHSNTR